MIVVHSWPNKGLKVTLPTITPTVRHFVSTLTVCYFNHHHPPPPHTPNKKICNALRFHSSDYIVLTNTTEGLYPEKGFKNSFKRLQWSFIPVIQHSKYPMQEPEQFVLQYCTVLTWKMGKTLKYLMHSTSTPV